MVKINEMTAKEIVEVLWTSQIGENLKDDLLRYATSGYHHPDTSIKSNIEEVSNFLDLGDEIDELDLGISMMEWNDLFDQKYESAKVMLILLKLAEKIHKIGNKEEFNLLDYIQEYEKMYLIS